MDETESSGVTAQFFPSVGSRKPEKQERDEKMHEKFDGLSRMIKNFKSI